MVQLVCRAVFLSLFTVSSLRVARCTVMVCDEGELFDLLVDPTHLGRHTISRDGRKTTVGNATRALHHLAGPTRFLRRPTLTRNSSVPQLS